MQGNVTQESSWAISPHRKTYNPEQYGFGPIFCKDDPIYDSEPRNLTLLGGFGVSGRQQAIVATIQNENPFQLPSDCLAVDGAFLRPTNKN